MKPRNLAILLGSLSLLLSAVPVYSGDVVQLKPAPRRPGKCYLDVFETDQDVKRPFEKLCVISQIAGNFEKDMKQVRAAACGCGADAIILRSSGSGEYAHPLYKERRVSLNALGIRYTDRLSAEFERDSPMAVSLELPSHILDAENTAKWSAVPDTAQAFQYHCAGIFFRASEALRIRLDRPSGDKIPVELQIWLENHSDIDSLISAEFRLLAGQREAGRVTTAPERIKPGRDRRFVGTALADRSVLGTPEPLQLRVELTVKRK